ncbi:hypothetical protein N7533_013136 [Penicillium manginii]|uniref:uncharacterized protein n=1 Tax=Penicillium manginii TaxID=203109 RepID=UPI002548F830|nr:uncharacterized protein N7533_013136 [Penicillium manginii]KAJ5734733.1 hypothetical protein N7533_013136 [Penicillium manginii]
MSAIASDLLATFPISLLLSGLVAMGLLSWLRPSGRVSFYHAKDNRLLLTKVSKSGTKEQTSLVDICRDATPESCNLNPFLFNGHLQTVWTTLKHDNVPVYYKRKMFESETPMFAGSYAIDFAVRPYDMPPSGELTDQARKYTQPDGLPPRTSFYSEEELSTLPSDDTKPMLVLLHGLSGGSHEVYLRHILAPLVEDGAWEACVVNSRGCAQTKISTGVLYNARATWDVRQSVKWLRKNFPNRPLFGIGFSLGANILANYLGEEGEDCQLKAAVICASPWNLDIGSANLQSTFLGREAYSKTMGTNMKKLFKSHIEEISKNPRIDPEAVMSITYLHEFDRHLQCPTWGYPTEGAYYRDASSTDAMLNIRIPFLCVQAEDDPIASYDALPFQEMAQTPYGVMVTTSWGGHLGWFEFGGARWFVKPVNNFLNKMAREIDTNIPGVVENPAKLPGQIASHPGPGKDVDAAPRPEFHPVLRKLDMKFQK